MIIDFGKILVIGSTHCPLSWCVSSEDSNSRQTQSEWPGLGDLTIPLASVDWIILLEPYENCMDEKKMTVPPKEGGAMLVEDGWL